MSTARQRPHVVAHVAVTLDGATTGFSPDVGCFYRLAGSFAEDVTLAGADTILAQEAALAAVPRPGPDADGPLLAVVDGRGRVREWAALREVGHWSEVLALHAEDTPPRPPGRGVDELVLGRGRVDLAAALEALHRRGRSRVRVDSGGALVGALLAGGLLDEVSLLVHPLCAGAGGARWYGDLPGPAVPLTPVGHEDVGGGLLWLRYRVRG